MADKVKVPVASGAHPSRVGSAMWTACKARKVSISKRMERALHRDRGCYLESRHTVTLRLALDFKFGSRSAGRHWQTGADPIEACNSDFKESKSMPSPYFRARHNFLAESTPSKILSSGLKGARHEAKL